jgi:hypothetical protein
MTEQKSKIKDKIKREVPFDKLRAGYSLRSG